MFSFNPRFLRLDKSSKKICSTRVVSFHFFTKKAKTNKQLLPMKLIRINKARNKKHITPNH